MQMETSESLGMQPDGTATGLDKWSRSGGEPMVLAVALEKKDYRQSPKHATHYTRPGTGKALPFVKTSSLASCRI
jgi:hypothetical protein